MTKSDLYSSVSRLRAVDSVVQLIERLIVEQKLAIGEALPPERELAARLAVSRNILREALRILNQKGLIQVLAGRGAFVQQPSPQIIGDSLALLLQVQQVRLIDICDARLLIEPEVARLAAERATHEDISRLHDLMNQLHTTHASTGAHVEIDLRFHRAIAEAARHSVYQVLVDAVRTPVLRAMALAAGAPKSLETSDVYHLTILTAIANHDPEAAQAAMREHMAYIQDYIRRHEAIEPLAQFDA
jgi:GntR family transcriptional repressor for pyruvate dehydrogenase complex